MRRKRTIYFNDARHYYLFVFEPPMTLEDAWIPIDEVAGTAIDTFAYGVERGDGLFYPSKIGLRFGADMKPFPMGAYWRVWNNMQSLMDRGLDPLRVLIDRAHDRGMDFIASVRMPSFGGMNPNWATTSGGGGLALKEVQDHQMRILDELMTDYPIEGLELDVSFPGGGRNVRPEDAERMLPALSDYVERIREQVEAKSGGRIHLGARVYPTEALNLEDGLDVREWLHRGLLDYVAPLRYGYMLLDPDQPIDWLIEAAHRADTAAYGFLQPYIRDSSIGAPDVAHPTLEHARAAAANYWSKGVDGLYTWFMQWPLGDTERSILTELGHSDAVHQKSRIYTLGRAVVKPEPLSYPQPLPVEILFDATNTPFPVSFYLADDFVRDRQRIASVQVRIRIFDLVTADRLTIRLNGRSLSGELCTRSMHSRYTPYYGQWLAFTLTNSWPRKGYNTLEFVLEGRPLDLVGPLKIEEIEIEVDYGFFPTTGIVGPTPSVDASVTG